MEHPGSDHISSQIEIIQGDITRLTVDAIVNAANNSLLGGGGVDGAIHRAAGPQLKEYNSKLGGCNTGQAKLSPGFNLPARHVISTVGPVWKGGDQNEAQLLANCYRNSLQLAVDNHLKTIAFPCISTGVYGFPFRKAGTIALKTIHQFIEDNKQPDKVIVVAFSDTDYAELKNIEKELL